MSKYEVKITRIGYSSRRFEVTADNETEAEEKAMEIAGDYEFSEGDCEYECDSVTPLKEPDPVPQKHILITAEIEIGDGTGYDSMTLFNYPVDGNITDEDFRHHLISLMDVGWQQDGDYRYIAITDEKQNETRSCHLLATLED